MYGFGNRDWTQEARAALGIGRGKLPTHHIAPRPFRNGMQVYLAPQAAPRVGKCGRVRRRMSHRLFFICSCGRHIPAGRMQQHRESEARS